ncbi:MAG: hypothetical protein HY270_14045 [Deltaproteobacteria bacterium]|nr:hypothetical protein [Deltaproteobacteria bacterium]
MKKIASAITLLLAAVSSAYATQETFTTAGALDCTSVAFCVQKTSDNLFTLQFIPTYPTSAPSATGFNVNEPAIEVYNANGGLLDLNSMQIALTGSDFYNGMNFLGAVQLEVQDGAGNWSYLTQWSTYIGSAKGIYVTFNGRNLASPLVRNVKGVRFTGINGATAFRLGMVNLTAH